MPTFLDKSALFMPAPYPPVPGTPATPPMDFDAWVTPNTSMNFANGSFLGIESTRVKGYQLQSQWGNPQFEPWGLGVAPLCISNSALFDSTTNPTSIQTDQVLDYNSQTFQPISTAMQTPLLEPVEENIDANMPHQYMLQNQQRQLNYFPSLLSNQFGFHDSLISQKLQSSNSDEAECFAESTTFNAFESKNLFMEDFSLLYNNPSFFSLLQGPISGDMPINCYTQNGLISGQLPVNDTTLTTDESSAPSFHFSIDSTFGLPVDTAALDLNNTMPYIRAGAANIGPPISINDSCLQLAQNLHNGENINLGGKLDNSNILSNPSNAMLTTNSIYSINPGVEMAPIIENLPQSQITLLQKSTNSLPTLNGEQFMRKSPLPTFDEKNRPLRRKYTRRGRPRRQAQQQEDGTAIIYNSNQILTRNMLRQMPQCAFPNLLMTPTNDAILKGATGPTALDKSPINSLHSKPRSTSSHTIVPRHAISLPSFCGNVKSPKSINIPKRSPRLSLGVFSRPVFENGSLSSVDAQNSQCNNEIGQLTYELEQLNQLQAQATAVATENIELSHMCEQDAQNVPSPKALPSATGVNVQFNESQLPIGMEINVTNFEKNQECKNIKFQNQAMRAKSHPVVCSTNGMSNFLGTAQATLSMLFDEAERGTVTNVPLNSHMGPVEFASPMIDSAASGLFGASSATSCVRQPQSRKHTCGLCFAQFARKMEFKSHLRTHNSEYVHVCSLCSRQFRRPHDLSRHLHAHEHPRRGMRSMNSELLHLPSLNCNL